MTPAHRCGDALFPQLLLKRGMGANPSPRAAAFPGSLAHWFGSVVRHIPRSISPNGRKRRAVAQIGSHTVAASPQYLEKFVHFRA